MNEYKIINMNDVPVKDVPIDYYRHQMNQMSNRDILSLQCAGTLGAPTMTGIPSTILPDASVTFNLSWSGGTPPYRIVLYRDYGTVGFYDSGQNPNNIPGTTFSITRQLSQGMGWSIGTHTIQAQLHDSCTSAPGGKNVTLSTPQTVTISTAPPQQTYSCTSYGCQPSTCIAGTLGCYLTSNCDLQCAAPPPPPPSSGCTSGKINVPVVGCQSYTTIGIVGAGLYLYFKMKK